MSPSKTKMSNWLGKEEQHFNLQPVHGVKCLSGPAYNCFCQTQMLQGTVGGATNQTHFIVNDR